MLNSISFFKNYTVIILIFKTKNIENRKKPLVSNNYKWYQQQKKNYVNYGSRIQQIIQTAAVAGTTLLCKNQAIAKVAVLRMILAFNG